MNELKKLLWLSVLLFLFSCVKDEEFTQLEPNPKSASYTLNSQYNQVFEWDNVEFFDYKLGTDQIKNNLAAPWLPGSTNALGVPDHWIDFNALNPDPSKRMHSRENGWRLVYANLMNKAARNKYFCLYNINTGMLRFFFYAMESSSGYGTSTVFTAFRLNGYSSLLNFTYNDPLPAKFHPKNPTYTYTPDIIATSTDLAEQPLYGNTYKHNNWYCMEFECAFDPNTSSETKVALKLWAAEIARSSTTGQSLGEIKGEISTTYSGLPNFNLNFNYEDKESSTVIENYGSACTIMGEKVDQGIKNNDSFFKGIWKNLSKEAPKIITQGVKAGIKDLFTGAAGNVTSTVGKLVNKLVGIDNKSTMTSLSKVNLGTKAKIKLKTTTVQTVTGWGSISLLPIPNNATNDLIFKEKLGIWNIEDLPKVRVTLNSTSFFYPEHLMPNQETPRAFSTSYDYSLEAAKLIFNEKTLSRCRVENIKQELVFTNQYNIIGGTNPYGLNGNKRIESASSYKYFSRNQYDKFDYAGFNYNPTTSFNHYWNAELTNVNASFYCRISFQMVDRITGKRSFFSKYFRVKAVKNNHNHNDEII
ncbi:hypothetical protein EMN47_16225 [Prolixibacteraceae bacterium JC049]|nr:hypothetical protein [Prolixibacteraceae bacterium JC049]